MPALPFMPLYVADYLADAAHLSTVEHGAYLLLIMNYWQRGKPLPADDARLARIARLPLTEWDAIRDTLAEFFIEVDGEWTHKRVEQELGAVRQKSEQAKNAGRASAERRRNSGSTGVERPFNGRSTGVERTFNDKRSFNHTDTYTEEEKSTTSTDVEAAGLVAGLERLKPACGVHSDLSPEDEFWEIAETLQDRGVARSRMGELGKLHDGDFRALVVIAREIQRARSPSTYLGGIIKRRKAELAEDNANASARDGSSDEPEFIRAWRRDGDRVEVYGPNRWRLNGQGIYDEHGDQVGW